MAAHHSAQPAGAAPRFPAAALLLLLAAVAGAQPGRLSTPVCLFLPDDAGEGHTVRLIMDAELNAELRRLGLPVVPEAAWRSLLPADSPPPWEDPQAALRLAAQMEAAVAVTGTFRQQRTVVELAVRAYEVSTGSPICEIEQRSGRDISIYNQVATLAARLGAGLQAWLEAPPAVRAAVGAVKPAAAAGEGQQRVETREPVPPTPPVSVRVTLLSDDEGAEIWLGRESPAGTVTDGRLVLEAPVNSVLRIEKRKPGYHADREELPVAEDPVEVSLRPLQRSTRWAVELFYSSSQFLGLGAGFRLYLVPDYLALTAGHYSYFSLDPGSADGEAAYHGDFRLTAGTYLLAAPGARLRFGLATGMGAILSVFGISAGPAERETYTDLYWEILDAWLELNWKRFAVFLRAETRYALGLDGGVLERGFVSDYGPQYSLGWLIKL